MRNIFHPFNMGVGGSMGSGAWPFPWVHVDDVCGVFSFIAAY